MSDETPPPDQPWRPRFGIGLLLLLMTIVAAGAAGAGGLMRSADQRAFFVIFTLVTPGLALILAGLWQQATRRRR